MIQQIQLAISTLVEQIKSREDGQAMVEYGLILALVAVIVAAALTPLGSTVSDLIHNVVTAL